MKSIETKYHGVKFRSKLEARWAMFFDLCGIKWEYEPKKFYWEDGTVYWPDFLLHDVEIPYTGTLDIYVEVKGHMSHKDLIKIKHFTFGDLNTIHEKLHRIVDIYFNVNKYDGLGIPSIPYPIERRLAILGDLPLIGENTNLEDIKRWIKSAYGDKSHYQRAIYSCRNIIPDEIFVNEKFLPVKTRDGLSLVPLNYLDRYSLNETFDAYQKVMDYRFNRTT